jgi:hypothetical protein
VSGPRPAARTGAALLPYGPGQLLLYGGMGADGRPLDDAYVLDVDALAWSKVYTGHACLVGQEGALGRVDSRAACAVWHARAWDNALALSAILLASPTGAFASIMDGKLVLVHAAPGSTKLEVARSLDLAGLAASFKFTTKMCVDAVALLEKLEAWADKQAHALEQGLHMERLSESFDSLLRVLDSLYQVSLSVACAQGASGDSGQLLLLTPVRV